MNNDELSISDNINIINLSSSSQNQASDIIKSKSSLLNSSIDLRSNSAFLSLRI